MPKIQREPIALREKALKGGRKSLYLDYYVSGTRKHAYEFLSLYLIPEINDYDREKNRNTIEMARAIQAQRIIERARGKAGMPIREAGKILLVDYCAQCHNNKVDNGLSSNTTGGIYRTTLHLIEYAGEKVRLSDVDKAFCVGFVRYLASAKHLRESHNGTLSRGSANRYFGIFSSILNQAVRDGLLSSNPAHRLSVDEKKGISYKGAHREYLTAGELALLIQTECKNAIVRNAFLFACFTGLRVSDIAAIQWKNIMTDGSGRMSVNIIMKKTGEEIYIPLSNNALRWLPDTGSRQPHTNIFPMPSASSISFHIKNWAKAAGISKNISFHTSRHTFATLLLTQGADLYTTSKLLGHQDIKVTQVYADIVSKKRQQAVSLLDDIDIGE
ncbi:MAG: site-specific integrase [Bacteroidales bacterium]|nr:site-specific integrase [Bacteroidales bacterium]MCM1148081.1 site-specific integrase [Bacteroidales bacterium]MCM1509463.1 site-specific integrase [Clostridium sp.]